ncbi:hypothetical protein HK405_002821 [Cladochytrium tenue]|nr:hypothetical protein HK405_002821 [Cladochytrium tenue]
MADDDEAMLAEALSLNQDLFVRRHQGSPERPSATTEAGGLPPAGGGGSGGGDRLRSSSIRHLESPLDAGHAGAQEPAPPPLNNEDSELPTRSELTTPSSGQGPASATSSVPAASQPRPTPSGRPRPISEGFSKAGSAITAWISSRGPTSQQGQRHDEPRRRPQLRPHRPQSLESAEGVESSVRDQTSEDSTRGQPTEGRESAAIQESSSIKERRVSEATYARSRAAKSALEAKYSLMNEMETLAANAGIAPGQPDYDTLFRYNPLAVIRWRREAWQKALRSRAVEDSNKWRMPTFVWDVSTQMMREYFEDSVRVRAVASNSNNLERSVEMADGNDEDITVHTQPKTSVASVEIGSSSIEEDERMRIEHDMNISSQSPARPAKLSATAAPRRSIQMILKVFSLKLRTVQCTRVASTIHSLAGKRPINDGLRL